MSFALVALYLHIELIDGNGMKKTKKKKKIVKDLYLDRPTSHGGWPHGHPGSYVDPNTPVNKQIINYLDAMGLLDDDNPRAVISESKVREIIRNILHEKDI